MRFGTCIATLTFVGAAIAAPAPLALSDAQRLAIERSPLIGAYDSSRAAAQKTATMIDVARETALAWLDCYYIEQMIRVADEQLKAAQAELQGAERMYWAGRSNQAEFYGARSTVAMFEDKSSEVAHRARAARIALKRWIGDAGEAPLAAPPKIDRIAFASAALEGDFARHADVVVLDKQQSISDSDPLVARATRDERLRAKVAETRIMIDEWQHARDRSARYTREIVPLARERTLATLVAYRGGKATLTDVLAARRAETDARMQSVESERDAARMWAQINFALPETLPATARSRAETAQ